MLKDGKYRVIRKMPIGWVLQAIHSTNRSERLFRIMAECLLFLIGYMSLIET